MAARRRLALALLLGLALMLGAWLGFARAPAPGPDQAPVGLFTTLPILWNEAEDIAGLLNDPEPPHWARAGIARRGAIVPLDALAGPKGYGPLRDLRRLVIAQPRPLSPDENVALDDWVRGGGHLLLIADPALTEESRFALGDPRRPQGLVLLSPILRRWGLDLQFDDVQPPGERAAEVMDIALPVNLPGRFIISGGRDCRLHEDGLAAFCAVGKGRVVALADAAVLERADASGDRSRALAALLDKAFAAR
ncbi:ABC transporter [Novosphingobium sp.]|mgnify:CR=1 FL=1|uniref:ABC transporter n=1 Tax=Novosphingobium sp. TaxID=1874826 RepID=UPI001ED4DFDA|nr:ABC transporter [Novosphingobium sp.]MBK6802438.1 ABC transporter [Novosphingobium sp.]MBK9009503.1 ABC transporter [Novosphingobium sp.]